MSRLRRRRRLNRPNISRCTVYSRQLVGGVVINAIRLVKRSSVLSKNNNDDPHSDSVRAIVQNQTCRASRRNPTRTEVPNKQSLRVVVRKVRRTLLSSDAAARPRHPIFQFRGRSLISSQSLILSSFSLRTIFSTNHDGTTAANV